MSNVTIDSSQGTLRAYVARPEGDGPWPGVVVIHDIFGMTNDLRTQCDWLASEGFLAIGPDLYSQGSKAHCLKSALSGLRTGKGSTFEKLEGARAWLVKNPECTGKLGVIGYCLGGGFSLLLAPGHGYDVSSVNYGMIPKDAEDVLRDACPIVASFGRKDLELKGAAAKLTKVLERLNVESDVKEYHDVGHGFMNEHDGKPGIFLAVLGTVLPLGYNDAAASDARARIVRFFQHHLAAAP